MPRATTRRKVTSPRRGTAPRSLNMRITIAVKSKSRDGETWSDETSPVTSVNKWGYIEPLSSQEQNFFQSTAPLSTHRAYFRDSVTVKAGYSLVHNSIRYTVTDVPPRADGRFKVAFCRI